MLGIGKEIKSTIFFNIYLDKNDPRYFDNIIVLTFVINNHHKYRFTDLHG